MKLTFRLLCYFLFLCPVLNSDLIFFFSRPSQWSMIMMEPVPDMEVMGFGPLDVAACGVVGYIFMMGSEIPYLLWRVPQYIKYRVIICALYVLDKLFRDLFAIPVMPLWRALFD